jgi:hypothetical protein
MSAIPATPPSIAAPGQAPAPTPRPLFTPHHLRRAGQPLFRFDPGWLFLLAGLLTISITVLIPAQHDLDIALWQRERAAVIEKHRLDRIERYAQYLKGLESGDESVALSLAAVQLNKSPVDRVPLNPRQNPANVSASIFPHLEPPPAVLPGKPAVTDRSSLLARWAINDHTRLWMLAAGVLCILLGLLPAARSSRPGSASRPG